jgi:hypothetical protein
MTSIRLAYVKEYRDRTGKVRRYLRRRGKPTIPLPGLPGSRQFLAAYEAGLAITEKHKGKHADGTIGALVTGFYQSAAFNNLAPSSQQRYRLVLDKFSREDGHRLARDMPRRVAISVIEEIGETTPGMANLSASVLRRLFAYAIKKELRTDNPFAGIEPYKLGTTLGPKPRSLPTGQSGRSERASAWRTIYCSTPGNVLATLQRCAGPIYARA